MIKAEVVFDGDYIICNDYTFSFDLDMCSYVLEFENCGHMFDTLEEAIKFCVEN